MRRIHVVNLGRPIWASTQLPENRSPHSYIIIGRPTRLTRNRRLNRRIERFSGKTFNIDP